MSTKIYNAFEFNGSLDKLMEKLVEWKKQHFIFAVQWIKGHFDCSNITAVGEELRKAFASNRIVDEDCGLTLSVIPYEGRIFVKAFGSHDYWLSEVIRQDPDFKDFHYQNQTDRDEGITEEEWGEREKIWDAVSETRGYTFRDMGFTYEICTVDDCYLFEFELRKQARAEKSLG